MTSETAERREQASVNQLPLPDLGPSAGRCDCRAKLAEKLKREAIARKTAQAILRKGGHPFRHGSGL